MKGKPNQPMRSACRIALAFATLAVFLTSAGAAQAAFGPTGSFGSYGTGAGQLNMPMDVAIYGDYAYIADTANNRIVQLTLEEGDPDFLRTWGRGVNNGAPVFQVCTSDCRQGISGSSAGELDWPMGIATDKAGNVYVADTRNNRLQKYDGVGNFIAAYGWAVNSGFAPNGFEICTAGTTPCWAGIVGWGLLESPHGIDVNLAGTFVYVVGGWNNPSSNRVYMFNPSNGVYYGSWGGLGSSNGQFQNPKDVAVDADGNVYVADTGNNRLQKFTATGSYLGKRGGINKPMGVAVHNRDKVYVSEYFKRRVVALKPNGTQIGAFGWGVKTGANNFEVCLGNFIGPLTSCLPGTLVGQFSLPAGIDTDTAGNVYVANSGLDRMDRFGY